MALQRVPSNAKLNHNPIDVELRDANSMAPFRSFRSIERIPRAQRRKKKREKQRGRGQWMEIFANCRRSALDWTSGRATSRENFPRDGLSLKLETGRNYVARQKHEANRARYGPRTEDQRGGGERKRCVFFIHLLTTLFPRRPSRRLVCLAATTCSKFSHTACNFWESFDLSVSARARAFACKRINLSACFRRRMSGCSLIRCAVFRTATGIFSLFVDCREAPTRARERVCSLRSACHAGQALPLFAYRFGDGRTFFLRIRHVDATFLFETQTRAPAGL